ncbi:CHAP domain-containing protein [Peptococcus simiae]|uniref:CHAP domain-containing protein n=1 Tax=Peptococcus simiae TaxID=1643805 RepID=A0ABW9H2D2_9FIRM
MSEQDKNLADSTIDDARRAKGAVKMGKNTAKGAKKLFGAKQASQAVAAKGAGAAIGGPLGLLLTSKKARKVSAFAISCLITIMVVFLYALPTSGFEATESYFEAFAEEYQARVYSSTGNVKVAKVTEGFKMGSKVAKDIFASVLKLNDNDVDPQSKDGTELLVVHNEKAQKKAIKEKMEVCRKKVDKRGDDIEEAIDDNEGAIKKAIEAKVSAQGDYDEVNVNLNVNKYNLSDMGSAAVLGLYMVGEAGSLDQVRLSSVAKWLGYYGEEQAGKRTTSFDIYGVPCKVKTWTGTYLPQYLLEQKKQEKHKYRNYFRSKNKGIPKKERKHTMIDYSAYSGPATDLIVKTKVPKPEEWDITTYTETDEDGNSRTIAEVNVNIDVTPRDLPEIADLMGMWIGNLKEDQSEAISKLSVNMVGSSGFGIDMGEYGFLSGDCIPSVVKGFDPHGRGYQKHCTSHVFNRIYQVTGKSLNLVMGNGGQWWSNAQSYGMKVNRSNPFPGAAMSMPGSIPVYTANGIHVNPGGADLGHVAFVEKVDDDGNVYTSEWWGFENNGVIHYEKYTPQEAAKCYFIDVIDYVKKNR